MRFGLRQGLRLGVAGAVVLAAAATGSGLGAEIPGHSYHSARAVAPSDPDPDWEVAPSRADTRVPRAADAPRIAVLAAMSALVAMAAIGAVHRHRPRCTAAVALVPCGMRAPPWLLPV